MFTVDQATLCLGGYWNNMVLTNAFVSDQATRYLGGY